MGSVVQEFMFNTFSNEQEVETALITAEHVLFLNTHRKTGVKSSIGHSAKNPVDVKDPCFPP